MATITTRNDSYFNDMLGNVDLYKRMTGTHTDKSRKFFSVTRWWSVAGFLFVLFSIGAIIMGILGNTSYTLPKNLDRTEEVGIGTFNYNNQNIVEGINQEVANKNYSQFLAYVKGLGLGQRLTLVDEANIRIQEANALEITDPTRNWAIISANARKNFVDTMLDVENQNMWVIIGISIVAVSSVASIIILIVTLLKRKGIIASKNGLSSGKKNSTPEREPIY